MIYVDSILSSCAFIIAFFELFFFKVNSEKYCHKYNAEKKAKREERESKKEICDITIRMTEN